MGKAEVTVMFTTPEPIYFEDGDWPEPNRDGIMLFQQDVNRAKTGLKTVDCSTWNSEKAVRASLKAQLDFDYYDTAELEQCLRSTPYRAAFIHTQVPEKHIPRYYRRVLNKFIEMNALEGCFAGDRTKAVFEDRDFDD